MEEEALVLATEGDRAQVQFRRKSACDICRACSMGSGGVMIAEVENKIGAEAGKKVKVEIDSPSVLKAALIVYLFPLLGLISGFIIGEGITGSEATGIYSGIGGLILSFGIIYLIDKRLGKKEKFKPKIIEVIV
jgi:sigma-E factor negative regulatory protein RseC